MEKWLVDAGNAVIEKYVRDEPQGKHILFEHLV